MAESNRSRSPSELNVSIFGVIISAVFILAGVMVITFFASDNKSIQSTLSHAKKTGIEISAEEYDPLYDNEIVCVSGNVTLSEPMSDDETGFTASGIYMRREAEIYQWKEEVNSDEDGDTYTYEKKWVSKPIDSSRFKKRKYVNSDSKYIHSEDFYDYQAHVGAFLLPVEAVSDLALKEAKRVNIEQSGYKADLERFYIRDNFITSYSKMPEIGDIRIFYKVMSPETVTIVGRQHGDRLTFFSSDDGSEALLMYQGVYTLEQIIGMESGSANTKTALGIAAGAALIILGLVIMHFFGHVRIFTMLFARKPKTDDVTAEIDSFIEEKKMNE